MKTEEGSWKKYLILILVIIFLLPIALAYGGTNIGFLDGGITMISNMFNIRALQNAMVQEGFLKFMLFIVLFAVSNFGLKKSKVFDNKTAGIVSFAFSMIGIFMMPREWLIVTGGAVGAIMSSFIFLFLIIGGCWVSVFTLKPKDDNDTSGWIKNWLGLIILLLLLFVILPVWQRYSGLYNAGVYPLILLMSEKTIRRLLK